LTTLDRVILHLDMDAFYAAVEVRENPELRGKPVIVGHRGRRGVVSTCSYEARKYGIHSAMPSVTAERLCPDAIWIHGRMDLYVAASRSIRRILTDFSPVIEPLSIDEAFIDLTGQAVDLVHGARTAADIKSRIHREQKLTSSVGVAPNKFLAKVASDLEKPDGLVVFPLQDVESRLWPLPVERLWGVGPRTAERLRRAGITRVGQLSRTPAEALAIVVGKNSAAHLAALSRGEDDRPVRVDRRVKSISEERTYAEDLRDPEEIEGALLARAEGVARHLRRVGWVGRTVHLKVRTGDFTTWTRSYTLPESTDLPEPLFQAARRLMRERIRLGGRGVRLLGLGVSQLEAAQAVQRSLFSDPDEQRARRLARASDAVRDKLGEKSLVRARLIRKKSKKKQESSRDAGPEEASSLPSVD
jgi:DNA polymerase-4